MKHYNKRHDFHYSLVNDSFVQSIIQSAPAYEIQNSHLICYSRACSSYHECLEFSKGSYAKFVRFTIATIIWLTATENLCCKIPRIQYICRNHNLVLSPFINGVIWYIDPHGILILGSILIWYFEPGTIFRHCILNSLIVKYCGQGFDIPWVGGHKTMGKG